MPSQGTFVMTLQVFAINGPFTFGAGVYQLPSGQSASGTITYMAGGSCFALDGGAPIPFASLPAGWLPSAASISFRKTGGGQIGTLCSGGIGDTAKSISTFGIYGPAFQTGPHSPTTGPVSFPSLSVPVGLKAIDLLSLFTVQLQTILTLGIDVNLFANVAAQIEMFGNYTIGQQVSFSPAITTASPVKVGGRVKIASPSGLDTITQIKLTAGPNVIIINIDPQTPSIVINGVIIFWIYFVILYDEQNLWFYWPWGFGSYAGPVQVALAGTEFSGFVNLGILQVLFADASGIYTLQSGQTNDVLYVRAGFTTNVSQLWPALLEDDTIDDDFFEMLGYPQAILSQSINLDEEDFEPNEYSQIATLQQVVVTENIDIPSPFIKTALIP